MTSDHVTQHTFLTANKNIRVQSNKMPEMIIKCQKPTAINNEFKQDQKVQGQYTSQLEIKKIPFTILHKMLNTQQ